MSQRTLPKAATGRAEFVARADVTLVGPKLIYASRRPAYFDSTAVPELR
jgi:hypothetical protein